MKPQTVLLALIVMAATLGITAGADAAPVIFEERFLGAVGDADTFSMAETALAQFGTGNRARFSFDLTGVGGDARLINTQLTGTDRIVEERARPSLDAIGYDPALHRPFTSALLNIYVSDSDGGNQNLERLRIDFMFGTGGTERITSEIFQVNESNSLFVTKVDLGAVGWLDELSDGMLIAFTLAPPFGSVNNDFILEQVTLSAQTTAIPIPGSLVLLGSGLVGIILTRRRPG